MNKRSKSSFVLASVIAMILAAPATTWADHGSYDHGWNTGGRGASAHYQGHRGHHGPRYPHRYPRYYACKTPGNYRQYHASSACNTCGRNSYHHHTRDHDWW
jgi:hypothetical protein